MAAPASTVSTAGKVNSALTKSPLSQRCAELEKIFEESSVKDLHAVFSHLLEHIFGFNNLPGWSVNRIMQTSHPTDFHALKKFLGPEGPLMKLVYRLLTDEMFKFDFPIQCLPNPSRHLIEEGAVPLLYVNKLQFVGQGQPLNMLSLNAFELFIFHMAYLLVNPLQKTNWTNPGEALYATIVDDYLKYFLPLNKNTIPPIPNSTTAIRSPVSHHPKSPLFRQSPGGAHSPLNMSSSSILLRQTPSRGHSTHMDNIGTDTWRPETLLQVLCEFWLNQNSGGTSKQGLALQAAEHVMPTIDHVRIVRMMVKHVHYFINSSPTVILPSYQTHVSTPLEEFKKSVLPQIVQKKMYAFFRHAFDRWPLDSSFRLVLETWLSYIQPWRYTDYEQSKDKEDRITEVDIVWITFISENLLFYTNLFHEFLARVFRMDLTSPKNAYMMFRVTKVLCLTNLAHLLDEAEGHLYDSPRGHSHDIGASYLSPVSSGRGSPVTPHIFELEGPNFVYKPLFSVEIKKSIEQLLQITAQAQASVASMNKTSTNGDSSILSWLGFGAMVDYNASKFVTGDGLEEFNVGDTKKLTVHLETIIKNLCEFFGLDRPHDLGSSSPLSMSRSQSSMLHPEAPDTISTPEGCQLSPLGRYQLINGLRKFNVSYSGDPDLQPIRSFESAICVRFLHKLSTFLNEKYSEDIKQLCSRQDFVGHVANQYLAPPSPAGPNSPNASYQQIEPRVSLRFLAKKQTLWFLAVFYFIMYMWFGTGPFGFTIILIAIGLLYGVLGAFLTVKSPPRRKKVQ